MLSSNNLISEQIKKVAAINDLSGASRCSLTTAIPVLYAMGIQCCALPTAILSNHTGYKSYSFDDYTDRMAEFADNWKKQNILFDAVYTGFLGSERQIGIVTDFIKCFKGSRAKLIIDPVMGDNGKIYSTYTQSMCTQMKKLVENADVVTPNITEACALSDVPYTTEQLSDGEVLKIAEKIKKMGARAVVITGVKSLSDSNISNVVYDGDQFIKYTCKMTEISYSGTGDLFASIVCGKIVNNFSVFEAVKFATEYIYKVTEYSYKLGLNVNDGVCYEKFIKELIQ